MNARQVTTTLCIDIVEALYGTQESNTHLLELMNLEFPTENFTTNDLIEASQLCRDVEDVEILYRQIC